jgi:hypothetical protein
MPIRRRIADTGSLAHLADMAPGTGAGSLMQKRAGSS